MIGLKKHKSKVEFFSVLFFSWSIYMLFYVIGAWHLLSSHLRYLTLLILIIATIKAFKTYKKIPRQESLSIKDWIFLTVNTIISLGFFMIFCFAISGFSAKEKGIDIDFPLNEGYIGHGGSTVMINYHNADPTAQQYAIDISKINSLGMRTSTLFPDSLNDYNIYGDTLFSPCDVKVAITKDGLDNLPAGVQDNVNLAGNNVVLEYDNSSLIIFAHLLKNSLLVAKGDFVKKGQPLARIGNSGHTTEPHLHIHAISGTDTSEILNGNGIPIYFNGEFAVRNNRIKRK